MNGIDLVELSVEEMCTTSGGISNFNCWGGGAMTVLGFASGNAIAAAAGLWFMYTYC